MDKIRRRIISGAVLFGCAVVGVTAASRIVERSEKGAVPASLSSFSKETPVVILDAGHGASTKTSSF